MAQPQATGNGQIVPRDKGAAKNDLRALLQKMGPEIARALPRHVSAERMGRISLTALNSTPKLAQCTPESFLGCIVQAAQLGLEVNTPLGHAYLLPFEDRRNQRVLCQLIIGYQGMIELARRSGLVKAIYAFAVYEGDEFSWELGLTPAIKHKPHSKPGREEPAKLTHVYAVAKLDGGEPIFTVLTRSEVERYRKRSRASGSGPWVTDYEAMSLKTAIRRLYRWLPKSAEMARAADVDEAPETGRGQLAAVDPEVIGYLQAQGLPTDEGAVDPPDHDPETGEVLPAQDPPAATDPEPGSNG